MKRIRTILERLILIGSTCQGLVDTTEYRIVELVPRCTKESGEAWTVNLKQIATSNY